MLSSAHATLEYTGTAWQLKLLTQTARERLSDYVGDQMPACNEFTDPVAILDAWTAVHGKEETVLDTARIRKRTRAREAKVRDAVLMAAAGNGTSIDKGVAKGAAVRGATEREAAQAVERVIKASQLETEETDYGRTIRITRAGRELLLATIHHE